MCGQEEQDGRESIRGRTQIREGSRRAAVEKALASVFGYVLYQRLYLWGRLCDSYLYEDSAFASNPFVALVLRGMQAGVAAVILDVACDLGAGVMRQKSLYLSVILAGAFAADFFLGVNVIYIILAAAGAGILRAVFENRAAGGKEGSL